MRRGLFSGASSPDVARTFLRNFKLIEAVVHRHLLMEFLSRVLSLLHRENPSEGE